MGDIGVDALRAIHSELHIDPEWTIWRERGFSWVGYRLRQDFDAAPGFMDAGTEIYRVFSTIPVVENVEADDSQVVIALAVLNRFAMGEALVWDSAARRVLCHVGAHVHAQTIDWRPEQIAAFAVLALRKCEDIADALADRFRGRVSEWSHPSSGGRNEPDDMLWVGQRVFAPGGSGPSRFAEEPEMSAVFEAVPNSQLYSAGSDADGICIEFPFGNDTMLVELRANERHPEFGAGLLSTLKIRVPVGGAPPHKQAAELNLRETRGELPSTNFGAWCVGEAGGDEILAYARFTPNLLFPPNAGHGYRVRDAQSRGLGS